MLAVTGAKHPRLRRWGKRLTVFFACVFAFYSIEHWRGKREWDAFRAKWEARGERFDEPEPVSVPDDQNAAMVPLMQELTDIWKAHPEWFEFTRESQSRDLGRLHRLGSKLAMKSVSRGWLIENCQPMQLAGGTWTIDETVLPEDEKEAADEVVARFAEFSELFDEIDAMLGRPAISLPSYDRNDVHSTTPSHANELYKLAKLFHLRARAQIRLGDGAAALNDLERSLAIGRLLREERANNFRSWQMSTFVFSAMVPVVWEGVFSKTWNAEQLERLQGHIEDVNFARGLLDTLRYHRAHDIEAATSVRARQQHNARIDVWNDRFRNVARGFQGSKGYSRFEWLRPQGWRYIALTERLNAWQNAIFTRADGSVNLDSVTLEMVLVSRELEKNSSVRSPGVVRKAIERGARKVGLNYRVEPKLERNLPELGDVSLFLLEKYTFDRAVFKRLAMTAIALERFHSKHGKYPGDVSDLVPDFLAETPLDPWDGERPLQYALRPGGRPALWSIGKNRRDENGFLGDRYGDGDDSIWHYEIDPDDPDHPDRIAERKARNPSRRARRARERTR